MMDLNAKIVEFLEIEGFAQFLPVSLGGQLRGRAKRRGGEIKCDLHWGITEGPLPQRGKGDVQDVA